jgi:fatty acid synthase subunit beta
VLRRKNQTISSEHILSDTLSSEEAKVMIAGGFDDISKEGSYEFANIRYGT